eukprot:COSAG02_NODE_4992_length_4742_cov_8.191040_5_plen_152_part_00
MVPTRHTITTSIRSHLESSCDAPIAATQHCIALSARPLPALSAMSRSICRPSQPSVRAHFCTGSSVLGILASGLGVPCIVGTISAAIQIKVALSRCLTARSGCCRQIAGVGVILSVLCFQWTALLAFGVMASGVSGKQVRQLRRHPVVPAD